MASPSIRPHMLVADEQGNIYDHPDFLLLCRRGEEWSLPRPDELMPLPEESELFLLPGRRAVGPEPGDRRNRSHGRLGRCRFRRARAHADGASRVYDR